jgi:hypothetical protein
MIRRAGVLAASVAAAGILHVIAGSALAAFDPIAALLGGQGARVVAAAIGLGIARVFLFFVAPGWAAHLVAAAVARAIYVPPK